jgi:exodeoxyribonuclease VII large subunit
VSAVGHEIDVTLSDLVADVRALTPSVAAELVVPSADEIRAALDNQKRRLAAALRGTAADARARLDSLAGHRVFRRPFDQVRDLARQLDDLEMRAGRAVRMRLTRSGDRLAALAARLDTLSPLAVLSRGYSLTQRADNGQTVTDAATLSAGDWITTRFAHGHAVSTVIEQQAAE